MYDSPWRGVICILLTSAMAASAIAEGVSCRLNIGPAQPEGKPTVSQPDRMGVPSTAPDATPATGAPKSVSIPEPTTLTIIAGAGMALIIFRKRKDAPDSDG